MLEIGTIAPAFSLPAADDTAHTLREYSGKWVVLYFYPKDDTPGCTTEACGIAGLYNAFADMGVVVLGISKDSPASHAKFIEKYRLPFTLLSDEGLEVIKAYGAWQERSMYGRKFMGTARVTYVISPAGKIAKVYPKVTPASHALTLLEDLRSLRLS